MKDIDRAMQLLRAAIKLNGAQVLELEVEK
jgi:hypothetical protein